jgi:hypothetical protein
MVSEGELRAFRDENKMKFRKEDVDNLRKGRMTEPTLILPAQDEGGGGGTSETILDLDTGIQEIASADEAGPAVELPEAPPAKPSKPAKPAKPAETQDVTEQLDFSDTDITVADDAPPGGAETETGLAPVESEGEETGMSTEPLQLVEEGTTEPIATEGEGGVTEEMAVDGEEAAAPARRGRRRAAAVLTPEMEEEIESRRPHWIWSTLLVLTFLAAGYTGFFVFDLQRIETGRSDKPSGITHGLADWVSGKYYEDPEWIREFKFEGHNPNEVPEAFKKKPVWRFSNDDMSAATTGISTDKSMVPGSGTPAETPAAPPAEGQPPAEKPEGAPAAPAAESGPSAGGSEAKPPVESGGGSEAVPGMEKAGGTTQ